MKHLEITKKKNKGVCYGCKERYESCHDNCEEFALWKKQLEEEKKKRNADKLQTSSNWNYTRARR